MSLRDFRTPRRARRVAPFVALPLAVALFASCSGQIGPTAEAAVPATVPVSPVPPSTVAPTTVVPTTVAPTTVAPTTTQAPTTTVAETTTTESTTTTTLPPAPTTTLAPNVEIIGPAAFAIEPVGSRSGEATRAVQQRLIDLGFWHGGVDGKYGLTTRQAVMAFQKYLGLRASGEVDPDTAAYLAAYPERARGTADSGDLIEVDKTKQLLFVIRGGKTVMVLNTSTGNGLPYEEEDKNTPGEIQRGVSITPSGLWKVDRERPEGWWEGDLGEIYRPKYFRGGVAVHGSNSIPNYPASHGCVRVSVPAMDMIWALDLMPMRSVVWVHGESPVPA
jgi:peptidoglycan hydrolase-like protein with peptidoglycan-binding domain